MECMVCVLPRTSGQPVIGDHAGGHAAVMRRLCGGPRPAGSFEPIGRIMLGGEGDRPIL